MKTNNETTSAIPSITWPTDLEVDKTHVAFVSSCASDTRGHRAIGRRVLEAINLANLTSVSAIPMSMSHSTVERLTTLKNELRGNNIPLLIVSDFPDLPPSVELSTINSLADVSIHISMIVSDMYRRAWTHHYVSKRIPVIYDVVVASEIGACRTVFDTKRNDARCTGADLRIPPLIQRLPRLNPTDRRVWYEAVRLAYHRPVNRVLKERGLADAPVCFWLQSGFPAEMDKLEQLMTRTNNTSAKPRLIIESSMIERVVRAVLMLPTEADYMPAPTVCFATLADYVASAPGYSAFWELYALGLSSGPGRKVDVWYKLDRPVEGIDARMALLDKPDLLESSTAKHLKLEPQAGVHALARLLRSIAMKPGSYRRSEEDRQIYEPGAVVNDSNPSGE